MAARGNQRVKLAGRGIVTLRESDYVTSGGEGSIYRLNDTVVKLYLDADKMAREGMGDKITALSALHHPGIIAPTGVVESERSAKLLGFYMPWTNGEPMPRVFVNDFRTRTGFTDNDARTVVERMREIVEYAHGAAVVMADANELNWIVDFPHRDGPQPRVIDVDSWAVGRWPATVMMPSIRDWSSSTIDARSDWFAWAIVAFQVLIGIHPYKGKLDGYRPGELERRMRERKSVFAPGVRTPAIVRDLSVVPGPLLDWFRSVFEGTERTAPPSVRATGAPAVAARILRTVVTANGGATHTKLVPVQFNDPFDRVWPCGVARHVSGQLYDLAALITLPWRFCADAEVIRTPDGLLIATRGNSGWSFNYNGVVDITFGMHVDRVFRSNNRLFGLSQDRMFELVLYTGANRISVVTNDQMLTVPGQATQLFDGVAIVDALDAAFVLVPLPSTGFAYTRVPELDALTVIEGRAAGRFITLLAVDAAGQYHRCEIKLLKGGVPYAWHSEETDDVQLNVAILERGVAASIVDDGTLTLYVPSNGTTKRISDSGALTTTRLAAWEDSQPKVVYIKDGELWRVQAN